MTVAEAIEELREVDRATLVREYFFVCQHCNRQLPPTPYCLDRHLIREACKTDQ